MDLFWSGLARRASGHTWNERRSQFSKIHEMAIQDGNSKISFKPNKLLYVTSKNHTRGRP